LGFGFRCAKYKKGRYKNAIFILKRKERHLVMSFPDLPKPDRKIHRAADVIN